MARQRRSSEYESPMADEELAARMSSTAGRKLEERLESVGWSEERHQQAADSDEGSPSGV